MVIRLIKSINHPGEGVIDLAQSSLSGRRFLQIRITMASSGVPSKQDLEAGRGAARPNVYGLDRVNLSLEWGMGGQKTGFQSFEVKCS